ncbi:nodulation receptor kinase [Tanacetum coccineum]
MFTSLVTRNKGWKPALVCADKFRAGAFDQLKYNATTVPGLAHLHSLSPRLAHKDLKTANVLVDENFIAKVADAGVRNFLGRGDTAGSSSQVKVDEIFLALDSDASPKKSDIYSFDVFLLELVSGQEATELLSSDSNQNIVEWVHDHQEAGTLSSIIDHGLGTVSQLKGWEDMRPCSDVTDINRFVLDTCRHLKEKKSYLVWTAVGCLGVPCSE